MNPPPLSEPPVHKFVLLFFMPSMARFYLPPFISNIQGLVISDFPLISATPRRGVADLKYNMVEVNNDLHRRQLQRSAPRCVTQSLKVKSEKYHCLVISDFPLISATPQRGVADLKYNMVEVNNDLFTQAIVTKICAKMCRPKSESEK